MISAAPRHRPVDTHSGTVCPIEGITDGATVPLDDFTF